MNVMSPVELPTTAPQNRPMGPFTWGRRSAAG